MNYELLKRDPSLFMDVIFLSIVLTFIAYGIFPLIFAATRKKTITKKKYNRWCYGINALVMIIFIAINGGSSGAPYLFWTWVFSKIGLSILESNKILVGSSDGNLKYDPNRIVECKSCGYRNKEYFEACPQCGKHAKQYVYENQERQVTDKVAFCRICGEKLIDGSKFCRKCGTEVIEIPQ